MQGRRSECEAVVGAVTKEVERGAVNVFRWSREGVRLW